MALLAIFVADSDLRHVMICLVGLCLFDFWCWDDVWEELVIAIVYSNLASMAGMMQFLVKVTLQ